MISPNEKEHLSSLIKKCELGDIAAMEEVATFYYEDHPELMNDTTAPLVLEYYEKALSLGHQKTYLNLGTIYFDGIYAPPNYSKAIELFKLAISGDNARIAAIANAKLGDCYQYGYGMESNLSKAFDCYLEGVLLCNHPICLYKLGDMYRSGLFVNQSSKKAYFIYCKAKDASAKYFLNDSYAEILVRLAEAKIDGIGTDKDIPSARKYLELAKRGSYRSSYPEKNILQKIDALREKALNN